MGSSALHLAARSSWSLISIRAKTRATVRSPTCSSGISLSPDPDVEVLVSSRYYTRSRRAPLEAAHKGNGSEHPQHRRLRYERLLGARQVLGQLAVRLVGVGFFALSREDRPTFA